MKYILYLTMITVKPIGCPDLAITADRYNPLPCGKEHIQTVTDTFKVEFHHKINAVRYMEAVREKYDSVKLDSVPE